MSPARVACEWPEGGAMQVLKDIINRYKILRGHRVQFVPGWDCHGLPIEMKALAHAGAHSYTLVCSMHVHKYYA